MTPHFDRRWLKLSNHRTAVRATQMARAIEGAMRRYAFAELRRLKADPLRPFVKRRIAIAKSAEEDRLRGELEEIYARFGIYQIDDGARRAAPGVPGFWRVKPGLIEEITRDSARKVVLLVDRTRAATQKSIAAILEEALAESPRPSANEIARRIARSWFGPDGMRGVATSRGTDTETRLTADWRRRESGGPRPGEQEYLFSFDRAATIARTELVMAENKGIAIGFEVSGIEKVKWIAHPYDGRSGDREHWRMNDHPPITVAAMRAFDQSKWFELPSGIRAPYPGYDGLPASEVVNCRCTLGAVG